MALVKADRIKESSTSTGSSTFTLAGASTGFKSFGSVCSIGDTFYYVIDSDTGAEWETGLGTYSAANTVTRTTVHSSSNSNSLVAFSAGTKNVYLALNKTWLDTYATLVGTETLTNKTINGSNNTITNVSLTAGVTGTLPIANGGTGQTTAANAVNALLPTQTSNSGKFLTTNGTVSSWATVSASPAGSSGQVQYNSSGSFTGASKLVIQTNGWPCGNLTGTGGLTYYNTGMGIDVFIGLQEGGGTSSPTNGAYNTAYGSESLKSVTSGAFNTAIGSKTLSSGTNYFQFNTAVGYAAGFFATGECNTYIGAAAGQVHYGSYCILLGYGASSSGSYVNSEITLGNSSISTLRCAVTSITSLSDQRDKTNIQPMPSVLSFIASLNPVQFDWWMRDGAKIGVPDYGFIAQELKQAQSSNGFDWAQLVYESNPEKLEASPGKLIPILVKAIQELSTKVAALESAV